MIMTPWSWAIAYRRLQQGTMIRFGHANAVGIGTIVRLATNGAVLLTGLLLQRMPGIVVAATAVAVGVTAEALYAGLRVRPILRTQVRPAPRSPGVLTLRDFTAFYVPLALTSLISFFVSPIGSAAMSRMPGALDSLAGWSVVNGLLFVLRSPGMAFSEVVVARLETPKAYASLRRFARLLAAGSLSVALLVVSTPLAQLWLAGVMNLRSDLVSLGRQALWLAVPLPVLVVLQSWYQGVLVYSRQTRAITESVVLHLVMTMTVAGVGIAMQRYPGLLVTIAALDAAGLLQVAWLWRRSRAARQRLATLPAGTGGLQDGSALLGEETT
jgi:hypothetical protein